MTRPPFTLARHTVSILLTQALVFVLQFAALWLVAVGWKEQGTGAYGVVTTFQIVLQGVFSLGLAYANTTFVAKDRSRRDELHTTTLIITAVVSAVVVAGLLLGRKWISQNLLSNVQPHWLTIVAVCFPFALYFFFLSGLWTGEERIRRINMLNLLRATAFVAGVALAVLVAPGSVSAVLWAWAVSFALAGALSFGLTRWVDRVRWSWKPSAFREALRFSMVAYLGDVASILHQWFGLMLINTYFTRAATGAYFLALTIGGYFWVLAGALRRAAARRVIGGEPEPSWELVSALTRVVLWVLVVPSAVLAAAGPWLIPLVFRGFDQSVLPLQLVLPGFVLNSCAVVLAYYVIGNRRRPVVVTSVAWVGLAANVALSLALIRPLGVLGVAAAAGVSYSLPFLLLLPVFHRWGHPLADLFLLRKQDLHYFRDLWKHLRGQGTEGPATPEP